MATVTILHPGESQTRPAPAHPLRPADIDLTRLDGANVSAADWRSGPERTAFVEASSHHAAVRKIVATIAALEYRKPEEVADRIYNCSSAEELIAEGQRGSRRQTVRNGLGGQSRRVLRRGAAHSRRQSWAAPASLGHAAICHPRRRTPMKTITLEQYRQFAAAQIDLGRDSALSCSAALAMRSAPYEEAQQMVLQLLEACKETIRRIVDKTETDIGSPLLDAVDDVRTEVFRLRSPVTVTAAALTGSEPPGDSLLDCPTADALEITADMAGEDGAQGLNKRLSLLIRNQPKPTR